MNKAILALAVAAALAACSQMSEMMHGDHKAMGESVSLSGSNEVPPVTSSASASGNVSVSSDCMVTARIDVKGMSATAAHIHQGAPGSNGPVIVPFVKQGDSFVSQPNAKMTEEQCRAYKSGNTYVNVHSAAHPGGEIRAQLKGG
jgi:hypothetical protein